MGFKDRPKVDLNSSLSEKSVDAVKKFLNRETGFICREVDGTDDVGVDIYAELIHNSSATSYQIPIQVKSSSSYKRVQKKDSKSLSTKFKTSRLGYLLDHKPPIALLILYDESEDQVYYDFAFRIYNRLRLKLEDDSWMDQEQVTIHIPEENLLTKDRVGLIHSQVFSTYTRQKSMYSDHALNYDLPELDDDITTVSFLEQNGSSLYDVGEYGLLHKLFDKLNRTDLKRPKISLLGAALYTKTGEIVEASYFLELCNRNKYGYSEEEEFKLSIYRYHLEYFAGKMSTTELTQVLKEANQKAKTEKNKLVVEIGLLDTELQIQISSQKFDYAFFEKAERIGASLAEHFDKNDNYYFHQLYLDGLVNRAACRAKCDILLAMKYAPMSIQILTKLESQLKALDEITLNVNRSLRTGWQFALNSESKLLKAYSLYYMALTIYEQYFTLYTGNYRVGNKKQVFDTLKSTLEWALKSYKAFKELLMTPLEFKSISLAYEINALAKLEHGIEITSNKAVTQIRDLIESYSNSEFKTNWYSIMERSIERRREDEKRISQGLAMHLTDEEHSDVADHIIEYLKIPSSRKGNIIHYNKSVSYFYRNRKSKDLELTINGGNEENGFVIPSSFQIKSKASGKILGEGDNMEKLLDRI